MPVVSDIDSAANPDIFKALHVVQEPGEGGGATGASGEAAVEADAHHFGSGFAFVVQHVEGVAEVGEELVAAVEPLVGGEAHIVVVEGVGDDEVGAIVVVDPVGQVIGIAIGIVEEAPFFDDEAARVGAQTALVKAEGTAACDLGVDGDRLLNMLSFGRFPDVLIVDPAVAVASNLPACCDHRFARIGVAIEGHRDGVDRDG